jgi:hypothetical protein
MSRTFVALSLFLAASVGSAAPARAQYNGPNNQYNLQRQEGGGLLLPTPNPPPSRSPPPSPKTTTPPKATRPTRDTRAVMGDIRAVLRYPHVPPAEWMPLGQQFDPRQNRCVAGAPGGVVCAQFGKQVS